MTEPVAWFRYQQGSRVYYDSKKWDDCQPLYTTPLQRTWVGLTEAERIDIIDEEITAQSIENFALAQAIEAKLKELNT